MREAQTYIKVCFTTQTEKTEKMGSWGRLPTGGGGVFTP